MPTSSCTRGITHGARSGNARWRGSGSPSTNCCGRRTSSRSRLRSRIWVTGRYFFLRTPDELPLIDGIGFALDVGHANLNDGSLPGFLAHPIAHFHLHDNDGGKDTHSTVGEGTIDFRAVMDAVRKNNVIPIVEVDTFDGVLASIEVLRKL